MDVETLEEPWDLDVPRVFEVRRRTGQKYRVIVDAEDYNRVSELRWNLDRRGYVVRTVKGERGLKLHRFVLGLQPEDPGVDHRNGVKLDNRKSNLRLLSQGANSLNLAVINGLGASKYRGVTWSKQHQKWRAQQRVRGAVHSIGLHETEEAAARAVARFRAEHGLGGYRKQ